ncbi:MAG: tRNA preQ1(34) S-adenosylmethionine ribosyltransferase-isomerase QueA [Methylacidiphilales bacterium]|nr:tRNA preQ1(34) S-adenosylmethionine ribosyltransferase-isomerase QueA [Candidatus Methylacidiphilales bacterium]MDW8349924.1 tRNA preQ1(34) S-adenosylmethionine ribosyltransferase-isomerase QueA [Verrucomicrobiae bacterium]
MHRLSDYDFDLPEELIATNPTSRRDASRLMVLRPSEGRWEHRFFYELPQILNPQEDLLVLNDSRVIPAYLETEDRSIQLLLTEAVSSQEWICLAQPAKKLALGRSLVFRRHQGGRIEAKVTEILSDGRRRLLFSESFNPEDIGDTPLPPYILKRRAALQEQIRKIEDRERYQTIYARRDGSVAAPTAGLHFTAELLSQFRYATVTLHIGVGTFRPVKVENIHDHVMHTEQYEIPEGFEEAYTQAKRVVAVGTTSMRVLESAPNLSPHKGSTSIFIKPGFEFKRVDALITNFHLPRSTLLMLVAAFAGYEFMRAAYNEAIRERYRFFSYGDAMLILP